MWLWRLLHYRHSTVIQHWQLKIWYAIHTAHPPDTDTLLHLSLRNVWGAHTWHSLTWRKRCSWYSLLKWTHCKLFSGPFTMPCFSFLKTYPAILLWLINPDIWVMVSSEGKFMVREQKCECYIYYPWVSLLCHSLMRHVLEAEGELRTWLWYQQGKLSEHICVCVCVCVCLSVCSSAKQSWGFYPGDLGHSCISLLVLSSGSWSQIIFAPSLKN